MTSAPVFIAVQVIDGRMVASTTMAKPSVGAKPSDCETIALSLMAAARAVGCTIDYTPAHVAPYELCKDLLNPEALGFSATNEIRDRARMAIGLRAVEHKPFLQTTA